MINSTSEQEDRKAQRKKQEERARAVSAARKRNREEELKQLHLLATELASLMAGKARPAAPGDAWMFVDVGENHKLSFYREGNLISIRGRVDAVPYALDVSPRLPAADIAKAIHRKCGS
jgi:hypothetical protein